MRNAVAGRALSVAGTASLLTSVSGTALGGLGDVARGIATHQAEAGHDSQTVWLSLGDDNGGHGGESGDGGEVHLG